MSVYRPYYRDAKTGERRQSQVWWFEFILGGRRIRESAKTTRRTLAVVAEKRRRLEIERALAGLPTQEPERRVSTVASMLETYAENYAVNHRPKSVLIVQDRAKPVRQHLGNCLLVDLTEERITGYMRARKAEGASNRTINMELAVLSRAIGRTWRELWPKVRKLEERRDIGRALTADEEARLLEAAAQSKTPLLYPYVQTLLWTGARAGEVLALTWGRIDFRAGCIRIGASKTAAGAGREIPMAGPLRAVLEQHAAAMAARFGPLHPDWYVFPHCQRQRPSDPTRRVGTLRHAWELARRRAGLTCRLHDLRHSFCTKLGESGVAETVMLDLMGHVSAAMLRRYSHVRAQARQEAIAALERRSATGVPKEVPKVGDSGGSARQRKLLN